MMDPRPEHPGQTNDDPYCINCYCPSAFSCRRFSSEPWEDGPATIIINPEPTLLDGKLCEDYQPDSWNEISESLRRSTQ